MRNLLGITLVVVLLVVTAGCASAPAEPEPNSNPRVAAAAASIADAVERASLLYKCIDWGAGFPHPPLPDVPPAFLADPDCISMILQGAAEAGKQPPS